MRSLHTAVALLAAASFALAAPSAAQTPTCASNQIFSNSTVSSLNAIQRHVEAADLNGDQVPDLVVSSSNALVIAIGSPTTNSRIVYTPARSLAAGQDPTGVAIADLDGDGIKDIAVASDGGRIKLFHGGSTGGVADATFTQYLDLDYSSAWDIAVGDLNGDGINDLVFGTRAGSVVSMLGGAIQGVANGTFVEVGRANTSGSCKGLELRDLDRDGILDVAVSGENATVSILRGNGVQGIGNGTFTLARTLQAEGSTYDVTSGDFNHDGILDVASANYFGHSITVFLGQPNLNFAAGVPHNVSGSNPLGIASGDFDRDGYDDLVVATTGNTTAFAYFRNGAVPNTDGFSTADLFGPTTVGYGMTAVDLNRDGALDVLVPNVSGNAIYAAFNLCSADTPRLLQTTVNGSGSIQRDPNQAEFATGTVVTLTATADPNWTFSHWSGDLTGSENPKTITMTTNKFVVANFLINQRTLALHLAGAGQGTVTRNPNRPTYDFGSTVQLTANPQFGSVFAGWSGDVTSANSAIDVLMDADKTVTATFDVDQTLQPRIVGVTDVPLDQGGKVKLRWQASSLEVPGADPTNLMTQYYIWREIPQAVYLRGASPAAAAGGTASPVRRTATAEREYFWEFVVALPASRFPSYSYTASTTSDSSELGNPRTSFLVQARNAEGTKWWDSPPDSGYSVDNLSPPTPGPVVAQFGATQNAFHWRASRAPDLRGYRLHRGASRDFVPDASNLVGETRDTAFVDAEPVGRFYKLVALDLHGNRSHYVTISPEGPVAALVSLVLAEGHPDRIRLQWYVSEPNLQATLYRRTPDSDWSPVAVLSSDGRGFLDFEDLDVTSGLRYRYRLGIMDGDAEALFEETEVLADELRFAIDAVMPNPSPGDELHIRFSLPSEAPATLELLDVSGRLLAQREVAGRIGRQTVDFARGSRLHPGLYWIRLRQHDLERTRRAVVID